MSSVQSRLHISASLNSIVVELSENRESNAILSVRLETPSVSMVKGEILFFFCCLFLNSHFNSLLKTGGEAAVTVIMQSTFLEVRALAYQTPLSMEVLPISDQVLIIEALALRGDSTEVGITSKEISVQVTPDLLESLIPVVSALPLAEFMEFAAVMKGRSVNVVPTVSIPTASSGSAIKPARTVSLSVRVAGNVQIHLADLRSNRETEVAVFSLLSSNLEIIIPKKGLPQIALEKFDGIRTRYRPNRVEDGGSGKTFPAFLTVGMLQVKDSHLDISELSVTWCPELHMMALDLVSSLLVCGIAYKRIIPRFAAAAPLVTPRGSRKSPIPSRAVPLEQRQFPEFTASVAQFRVRALLGMRSAMRVEMDKLDFTASPAPSVQFTNATYAVAPNQVDFRQILLVPELKLSLRFEPRSIIALTLWTRKPHWALPYKFDFGSIVDETATVAKSVAMTTAAQLRARGLIPPATGRGGKGLSSSSALRAKQKQEIDDETGDDDLEESGLEDSEETSAMDAASRSARNKPPRFVLSVQATVEEPTFELMDNPFEVRLATAYRVRMDELAEMAIREEMLLRRFSKLRRGGNLSDQAQDVLLAALAKENVKLYIRRVREAVARAPQFVHRISSPSVKVELNIDVRPLRLKKKLRRLNKASRFFPDNHAYIFDILVGLRAKLETDLISLQHRDLPHPWVHGRNVNLSLDVIVAEDWPKPESEIHWTVLTSATRSIHGVRTSTGVKMYHNIKLQAESVDYIMGKGKKKKKKNIVLNTRFRQEL